MTVLWLAMALVGLLSSLTFLTGYHLKTGGSWRYYAMGRHLVQFIASLAVVFGTLCVSLLWGPLGPWPWIGALGLVNVVLFQRNWLLFTSKWRLREDEKYSDHTIRD